MSAPRKHVRARELRVCSDARLTHANNSLNVNAAHIDLLGKLVDGLVGVFIGERVHVDFDSWRGAEVCSGKETSERCRG